MLRPKSDSPAACEYTCPTGGVRYYFTTDTHALRSTRARGHDCPAPGQSALGTSYRFFRRGGIGTDVSECVATRKATFYWTKVRA